MVTYETHFGDGIFGDDRNEFFDTREKAIEYIERNLPRSDEREYDRCYLYLVVEDEYVDELYEDYRLHMSKKTYNSAVKYANISKFWNKKWEYVGDLFDVDFWRWGK